MRTHARTHATTLAGPAAGSALLATATAAAPKHALARSQDAGAGEPGRSATSCSPAWDCARVAALGLLWPAHGPTHTIALPHVGLLPSLPLLCAPATPLRGLAAAVLRVKALWLHVVVPASYAHVEPSSVVTLSSSI